MNRLRMFVCGLVSLGAAVASAGGLPPGYFRVSYIQGDGSKAQVITDYVPHPSTDRIVADVEFVRDSDEGVWCSRGSGTESATWLLFRISKKCRFDYGNPRKSTTSTKVLNTNTRYTFTATDNHVAISTAAGLIDEYDVSNTTAGSLTESGGPLCLFCSYHSGVRGTRTYYGNFKLYSLKVYRKNAQTGEYELLYDFVPVQDANREFRLWNATDNSVTIEYEGTFSGEATTFIEQLAASTNVVDSSEFATGGDIIWKVGQDYVHIFTNANEAATFMPTAGSLHARVLMVGGGGSGGGKAGGGGGAGGMVEVNDVKLKVNVSYDVVVGKGGDSVSGTSSGVSGGDSTLMAGGVPVVATAIGGGGGGCGAEDSAEALAGLTGGSGGGGGSHNGNVGWTAPAGGSGTSGQGCDGGAGSGAVDRKCAGGGGGAGSGGGSGGATKPDDVEEGFGIGGQGKTSDILGYNEIFAGGGGGGVTEQFTSSKNGGLGGGGAGGILSSASRTAQDGMNGLGGGGGGAANAVRSGVTVSTTSGAGGNGIVIIRYCYQPRGLTLLLR